MGQLLQKARDNCPGAIAPPQLLSCAAYLLRANAYGQQQSLFPLLLCFFSLLFVVCCLVSFVCHWMIWMSCGTAR